MNRIVMLCGITALAYLTGCKSKAEEKEEQAVYATTSPIVVDTSVTKDYVAQIQSLQNVELHAMVEGYMEKINVDEGQRVTAGQVLFNIRPIEFQAELAKASAEAKAAELELKNVKTLNDKNIVSATELALAQAKFDQAKAEVALAELNLSYCEIKAPFDGVIDRIRFKAGSLIDKGTLLTTVSNNKEMYAYFNVSEAEYLNYKTQSKEDQKESITLFLANGQEHKYKGTIETVEGEFDNETGNIAFRGKFPNPDLLLKHGETGKVRLTIPVHQGIVIPQKATYELQDKINVFVVGSDNVVHSKSIKVIQKIPNLYVVEGLTPQDKILLEGLQNVKDDDKVETKFEAPKDVIAHLQLINQ
ncbi:MAG: efflux RND transporter periplasmic adaptor subunit [Bacteroidia bacterium]